MRPLQSEQVLGRPVEELVDVYLKQCKKCLCDNKLQRVFESVHISLVEGLSLSEYVVARQYYCSRNHKTPCTTCERMLNVAQVVLSEGYCSLSKAFGVVSQEVTYSAEKARRKLLQMPLVSIRIGNPAKGKSSSIILEHFHGVNYSKMSMVIAGLVDAFVAKNPQGLEKKCVKMLLGMAQSDRERECLRYAIFKSSGMSSTRARHEFGLER